MEKLNIEKIQQDGNHLQGQAKKMQDCLSNRPACWPILHDMEVRVEEFFKETGTDRKNELKGLLSVIEDAKGDDELYNTLTQVRKVVGEIVTAAEAQAEAEKGE